jgi:hypothetical protein
MSILSVAGNAALQLLESLTNHHKTGAANSSASTSNPNGTADLSQVSKLESLAQTPDQFKQLTAKISSELNDAAQQASGATQLFLQQLASNFQTASQTGSTASLQPSQQAVSGTHPHHHGGAYHQSQQSGDPADLPSALSSSSSGSASAGTGTSSIQSLFQGIYQQVMQA